MTYPYLVRCGGVAAGTSRPVCMGVYILPHLSGKLQSSQNNDNLCTIAWRWASQRITTPIVCRPLNTVRVPDEGCRLKDCGGLKKHVPADGHAAACPIGALALADTTGAAPKLPNAHLIVRMLVIGPFM